MGVRNINKQLTTNGHGNLHPESNKCSDRKLCQTSQPADQPTNQQTEMRVHKEVTLPEMCTILGKHQRVCSGSLLRTLWLRPGQNSLLLHCWQARRCCCCSCRILFCFSCCCRIFRCCCCWWFWCYCLSYCWYVYFSKINPNSNPVNLKLDPKSSRTTYR